MDRKKILSFQKDEETIQSLKEMIADSNWEVNVKNELDQFLLELDPDKYHLLIVEEEWLQDDVRNLLENYHLPVIYICDIPGKLKNKIVLHENFSAIDLKKAMTKASFLKISLQSNKDDDCCIEHDDSGEGEEAVLLEPVLSETEPDEAVVLTPEDQRDETKSSWEIPEKEALDICDVADNLSSGFEEEEKEKTVEEVAADSPDRESALFDKMDEIDNLIKDLSDEIANEKPFGTQVSDNTTQNLSVPETDSPDIFNPDDDGEENLFDDEYSFPEEECPEDKTIPADSEKKESQAKIASDFESIMSSDKKDDYEQEWLESEKESEPVVEEVEAEPVEEVEAEPVEEVEAEPVEEVEAEPVEEVEAEPVEEVEAEPVGEVEDYRKEIHLWLEKNGRKIIKEVIEEQLSKIWEKK